jgi:8-oxo-dGTP pyrophosphatase MutT (NUDIX family)
MTGALTSARHVVAAVLLDGDDVCLLRRSQAVTSDRGLWHCVTGYLQPHRPPFAQTLCEISEETGLRAHELQGLGGDVLMIGGWTVHVHRFGVQHRRVRLNWENDAYRWVHASHPTELPVVPWLPQVLAAALATTSP